LPHMRRTALGKVRREPDMSCLHHGSDDRTGPEVMVNMSEELCSRTNCEEQAVVEVRLGGGGYYYRCERHLSPNNKTEMQGLGVGEARQFRTDCGTHIFQHTVKRLK